MGLRVAIGGISHETNTFCRPTPLADFHQLEGEAVTAAHRGVRSYIGGMLDAAERLGATALPTYMANATPSGTIERAAFAAMLERLRDGIRRAGPVDAVCLALHGAGVAEGEDDIETVILREVRDLVGPGVPVAATLDLHGNLMPEMLAPATALFGVQCYPHTDSYERGVEAIESLDRVLRGAIRPVMHLEPLPLLIPTTTSDLDPVRSINAYFQELERQPGVLDVTLFHGFPHTDIPKMGVSVLVIADGDADLARRVARQAAQHVWERRAEFDLPRLDAPAAIAAAQAALTEDGRPVVMNDTSDNPGAGSPGDGTHLLRALLAAGVSNTAFGFFWDPETVATAHKAGVGATIDVRLGGRTYPIHGEPIAAPAYVKCLTDGRFTLTTPMGRGRRVDLGPTARLQIGGIDVLAASVRSQVLDPEIFLLHGIDVARCDLVVVKSSNHFRAGFREVAARIVTADTPGLSSCNLRGFPYRRLQRPVAPLDADAAY